MCVATKRADGAFEVDAPELVGDLHSFWDRLHQRAGSHSVFVGFDFPIGIPMEYAEKAGLGDFKTALELFGRGSWEAFYDVARVKEEVDVHRPFYPYRPGGTSHAHLLEGLGVAHMSQLLRRCEQATRKLGAASPLFWTLGGKQVGRAAIIGWRDVIAPAIRRSDIDLKIWPFDGKLHDLLRSSATVVAETYPASACVQLGLEAPGRTWSKTSQEGRRRQAERIFNWAASYELRFSASLTELVEDGFGSRPSGEDPFDAAIGALSMLDVLHRDQKKWAPDDPAVRELEGWILGRDWP